ncbi:hypothetical protein NHX12_007508, partial [Muraenolepis orangiensis]
RNKVVSRKTHQVDLRGSLGVVTLHVVLPPEDVKAQTVVSSQEEEQATLLRVTSERDREFLELFFEQCITDPVLKKHGKNTWLLQMPNKSVMDGVYAREPQKHGIFLEVYEEKEEEDMVDKRRYVLSGLDDGCFADSISLYIHSCSHRAEHTWKAVGGDSIMVTFKEDIDGHKFMEKTSFKKLNNKKIEACHWRVAQRVAEAKHTLMGKKCVAQLFHPDLQRPQLELKMSMDKQLLGLLRHGPSWETNARREVQTHLEMYMVEHIPMEAEVWQAVKGSCAEVKEDTALISFKICSSELVVVGRREEVKTLVKIIKIKDNIVAVVICSKETVTVLAKKVIGRVSVILKKADITKEAVDVIVNSSNQNLNLDTGVSGAILIAAGQSVVDECKKHSPQEHCESKQAATVSIPTIGTGRGGSDPKDSAKAILQVKIKDILIELKKGNITTENVKAIVNSTNEDVNLKHGVSGAIFNAAGSAVEAECATIRPLRANDAGVTSGGGLQCDYIIHIVGPASVGQATQRVKSVLKHCEDKKIPTVSFPAIGTGGGGLKFIDSVTAMLVGIHDHLSTHNASVLKQIFLVVDQVKAMSECQKGLLVWTQLKQEKTEAIVNSTNTTLNLPSGVSGAILKAAGQAVVDECTTLGTQPADGVVITKAGNLAAKHIIHMVGPTKEQDITSSMLKVFKLCEDNKILSVAFPAIGTGAGKLSAVDAGNAMQPSLCLASACRDVTFPKVEVEVLGCCSSDMEKVKKLVDELVTEDWKLYPICSPHLPLLHDLEKQHIVALSRSLQVCVSISSPDTAIASGKAEDALTLVRQMENYLQKAKEYVSRQDEEKRLRETVQWEVSDGETWAELDQAVSLDLEQAAHKKQSSISYTRQRQTYTVNLDNMVRTDKNGTTAKIKRTLKADSETTVIEPPRNWDKMENKMMDEVNLSPTSKEYQTIQTNFLKTSKNPSDQIHPTYTVVKIQRIQNQEQWQKYAVKKQMLDKKYPKTKNEINLYHGSTAQICQKVNNYGFNRSFCGRNATVYGNGTYFGKESWYSCADQYSNPDAQGVKYMYQARVLVGKPCLGIKDMIEPTPLDPSNPHDGLHDCAVNNLQSPFIYVVFSDAGAYPEYLISFKAS